MSPPNQRVYKVISLLLKAAILILSVWYIIYRLNGPEGIYLWEDLKKANPFLLFISFLLLFVNWGLEALKWMLLISPLERTGFFTAYRSVLAGVTVSIFMPNRVGEFAGRIFFLEKADKVEATLKNFVGSAAQLFMTVAIGIAGVVCIAENSGGYWKIWEVVDLRVVRTGSVILLLLVIILLLLNRFRPGFSPKTQSYFKAIFGIKRTDLAIVFTLSFLRYWVFLFQYVLVLRAFGVEGGFAALAAIIAVTFLINSAIPSFALTEVVTRGAVMTSLFTLVTEPGAVIAASLMLWIINLGIPALTGSIFIWKLKFFKT